MEELPLQGRNWMELSKLIKGITANDVGNTPGVSRDDDLEIARCETLADGLARRVWIAA